VSTDRDTLRVTTADNVDIGYHLAGLATRLVAGALDLLIVTVIAAIASLVLFSILAGGSGYRAGALAITLIAAADFFVVIGYFTISQTVSGGRTLGKSALGLRVIRADGGAPGFGECFLRSLGYLVDIGLGLGPILMFFTPNGRRLGDYLGGTLVAVDRPAVPFSSVAVPTPVFLRSPDPGPPLLGLDRLGEHEFRAARTLLSRVGLMPERRAQLAALMAPPLYARMGLPDHAVERNLHPEQFVERVYMQLAPRHGP